MKLDDIDRGIISVLADNGRCSFREIGRLLDISESAVRQRVSRLIADDIIRITAVGNLNSLGFDVVAMVLIKVKPGTADICAEALAKYSSVRFVALILGNADIIIQTLHNSLNGLHEFVNGQLPRDLPNIESTQIHPEVRTLKSSWDWNDWFGLQQQEN